MKPWFPVLMVVLAVGAHARAAPPAKRPRFMALAAGKVAPQPAAAERPASIAASDRAPGFVLGGFPPGVGPESGAFLFSTDAAAGSYARDPSQRGDGCFAVSHPHVASAADGPLQLEERPHLSAHQSVMHVRHERLMHTSRGFELALRDAWIDPRTRGARLIGQSSLPLSLVAKGPSGVHVYAAREGRSVHFVVTSPRSDVPVPRVNLGSKVMGALLRGGSDSRREHFIHSMVRGLSITRSDGEFGRSDCGHARVRLDAADGGSAASVVAEVVLPRPPSREPDEEPGAAEARIRSLAVHLSVSQLSADRTPVYTVSFGWLGRTRKVPM